MCILLVVGAFPVGNAIRHGGKSQPLCQPPDVWHPVRSEWGECARIRADARSSGPTFGPGRFPEGTMRVLCFLFLVLFVAVVGGFAYQNWNHEVTVTVWDRNLSMPLPAL